MSVNICRSGEVAVSEPFQNWIRYQNGTINEGDRNLVPRIWNNSTGLNNNPIKRRKMPK